MCFSATASFVTSAGLLAIAAYEVTVCKKYTLPFIAAISVPLVFGIQQLFEGIVWLSLQRHHHEFVRVSSLIYLFFAEWWWPTFVPLVGLVYETKPVRRIIFKLFVSFGFIFGCYLYLPQLFNITSLHTVITNHCIQYQPQYYFNLPTEINWFMYLLCVPLCLVFSSNKMIWVFCALLLVSFIISNYFYYDQSISVWCFFSAIISFLCIKLQKTYKIHHKIHNK